MRITNKRGNIVDVDSWFALAPPKGKAAHWVAGHSAMELAVAWCGEGSVRVPQYIKTAIESHPDFRVVDFEEGEPEAKVAFDDAAGEPRNADLVIRARDALGPLAVSIEAKADESFGEYLGVTLADALERRLNNTNSDGVGRINRLLQALLHPRCEGDPSLRKIRYQLLTATAGALAWAEACNSDRAILLIHEFVSAKTNASKQERNQRDLEVFLHRLSRGGPQTLTAGGVIGPFRVPGNPLFRSPAALYFGKVRTTC